jgi:hypothetical protein
MSNKKIVFSQNHTAPAGPSERAVWGVGLDRLDAETVGSNPV